MSNRTYTCLFCGKTVTVSADEYRVIKQHPICGECTALAKKAAKAKTESKPVKSDSVSDIVKLVGKSVDVIAKTVLTDADVDKTRSGKQKNKEFPVKHFSEASSAERDALSFDDTAVFDNQWKRIGCLGEVYDSGGLSTLSRCVGLYMHKIGNEIMYIGRAVEYNNGGLRKRLSDYCRPNGSARKHPSGQKIYANRYKIQTYILVVGDDAQAAEKSKRLEELYVGKYNPPWNSKLKTNG